jgi:sensor histidine kinase regulating citrate/malate metabolism
MLRVNHSRHRIGLDQQFTNEEKVMANNRAVQDAIGKLVGAQGRLVRPMTDEDGVAWNILDDAIGYLIGEEYPLWNLF